MFEQKGTAGYEPAAATTGQAGGGLPLACATQSIVAHSAGAVNVGEYWDNDRWEWAPILACPWSPPPPRGGVGGGSDVLGLSTAHILPQHPDVALSPPEFPPLPEDWSYLPPEREPETHKPDRAAYVEAWSGGSLVLAKRVSAGGRKQVGGGRRGDITTFSRQSRRRLMQAVAKVRRELVPTFVTLTYPAVYSSDPTEWKRHLKVFWQRMKRKFPTACFFWRLEFQKRGAPHFHLLVWGVDYKSLLSWVPSAWYEVVASGDEKHLRAGTRVERLRSFRSALRYASKELAKVDQASADGYHGVGRWWGVYGRGLIPWAVRLRWAAADGDVVQIMRWFRRFAGLRSRSYKSLSIFCDGSQWAEKIRAGPDPPGRSFLQWVQSL
jgi:hypothetical protein